MTECQIWNMPLCTKHEQWAFIVTRSVIIPVLDPNPAIPIPGFYHNYNSSNCDLPRSDLNRQSGRWASKLTRVGGVFISRKKTETMMRRRNYPPASAWEGLITVRQARGFNRPSRTQKRAGRDSTLIRPLDSSRFIWGRSWSNYSWRNPKNHPSFVPELRTIWARFQHFLVWLKMGTAAASHLIPLRISKWDPNPNESKMNIEVD